MSSNHTQSHIICEERLILLYYPFIIFIQFYTGGYNRYDTSIYIYWLRLCKGFLDPLIKREIDCAVRRVAIKCFPSCTHVDVYTPRS